MLLNADNAILAPYVTESFKTDCQTLTAEDLIEKYGTHTLISLYLGAKLTVDYQAEYSGEHPLRASKNSFKLGLFRHFELPPSVFPPYDLDVLKGISNPKLVFEAIGGDTSKIKIEETDGIPVVKIDQWKKSITEENARFAYLDPHRRMLLISEFIEDADKRQEVEDYINDYIKANEVKS